MGFATISGEGQVWSDYRIVGLDFAQILPSSYLFVDALPENGEDVDGADRRRQIARHGLDVVEQLTDVLYNRDPSDANTDQYEDAASDNNNKHP